MTAGIIITWWLFRDRDSWIAGVPLGAAAALRIYPTVLILVLLVGGRRRGAATAIAVALGANLLSLFHPAVTLEGSLRVLTSGELLIGHNANVALPGLAVFHLGWSRNAAIIATVVLITAISWWLII